VTVARQRPACFGPPLYRRQLGERTLSTKDGRWASSCRAKSRLRAAALHQEDLDAPRWRRAGIPAKLSTPTEQFVGVIERAPITIILQKPSRRYGGAAAPPGPRTRPSRAAPPVSTLLQNRR